MSNDLVENLPPPVFEPRPTPARLGRSTRRVALVLVAVAVAADLALQTRIGGFGAMVAVTVLCLGLARTGWVVRTTGRILLFAAALLSIGFFVRSSPWLTLVDVAAIAMLLALACSAERDARAFDTRFSSTFERLGVAAVAILVAVPAAVSTLASLLPVGSSDGRRLWSAVLRGLVISVPIVVLLGANLAMADAVFASLFDIDIDLTGVVPHTMAPVAATWVAAGFFVLATRPPVLRRPRLMSLGPVEGTVVMTALVCIYAVFAASQALVASRGPGFVEETTGLTYAEYARSGFFQLLWVAALTALTLLALRALVEPAGRTATRWFAAMGAVAAVLTLVVIHAAINRLNLYETVFGLTSLRFYSTAFAWFLGAVFVLVGLSFAVAGPRARTWLPTAIGLTALAAVVLLNFASPEDLVMRHNIERAGDGNEFDISYALTLSTDATPALVDGLAVLDPLDRAAARGQLCAMAAQPSPMRWNLSAQAADSNLRRLCR